MDENRASEDEDEFDDEDSCFTTGTLDGDDLDDVSDGSGARAGRERDDQASDDDVEEEGSRAESGSEKPVADSEGSGTSSARNRPDDRAGRQRGRGASSVAVPPDLAVPDGGREGAGASSARDQPGGNGVLQGDSTGSVAIPAGQAGANANPPGLAVANGNEGQDPAVVNSGEGTDAAGAVGTGGSKAKGRSICHEQIKQDKLVFVSLDLETGGEDCGIIQLSAEIVRVVIERDGAKAAKDTLASMSREGTLFNDDDNPTGGEFNEYVNPGRDAVWSDAAIEITGLSRSDPKIASARSIIPVWGSFCSWIETNIADDEVGAIVAYNGAGCDMKWIWQLTQAPNSPCDMPEKLAFYVDPLKIIRKWKSCRLHQSKSKLETLALGAVWSHIKNGEVLEGAHDSIVDARAQTDLILHPDFIPFIDRTDSFTTIDKVFKAREESYMKKKLEPLRPVHDPWVRELFRILNV